MNTRLTVADVRQQLWKLADSGDINSAKFLNMLNETCEKYIYSGKWKGCVVNVDFDNAAGYISLPREYESVLCMTYNGCPALTYTQFHTYQENGPGDISASLNWPGILIDLGDGFVTQSDITTAGTLRINISGMADATKTIWLNGLDENGVEIYDPVTGARGIPLVTVSPTVETTQQFSVVTGIQAGADPDSLMKLPWTLWVNNSSVYTQIGSYQPGEQRPMYRRYQTGQATQQLRLCCQRRFVLMRNETDWVIPGNLSALRAGFWSLNFIDGSDLVQADASFQQGLTWLNNEAKASRGGGIPTTNIMNWGMRGGGWGAGGGNGMVYL